MNEDKKVAMLLDIDNYFGESEGRLGPTIKFLIAASLPILIWVYTGFPVPPFLFWPLCVIWIVRMGLIILGHEKERLIQYHKQINDEYSPISDLMNIKTIHPDGCIEYINGMVAYMVVAVNGTVYNSTSRAQQIQSFLSLFGNDYDIDIYVQNITDMRSLEDRYNHVQLFVDADAAQDFIDIIDHNRQVVYSQSLLTRSIFVAKGRKADWQEIRDNCKMAAYSAPSKAFKEVSLATREEIQDVLNTDVRGSIDLDAILREKYATHQYYGSKVLYFDDPPKEVLPDDYEYEERGFMVSDD